MQFTAPQHASRPVDARTGSAVGLSKAKAVSKLRPTEMSGNFIMSRLEAVGRENWKELVNLSLSVLILGRTDCPACKAWTEELVDFLAADKEFAAIRFGKIELDRPGLIDFKRANPWLCELDDLPYNVIYQSGDRFNAFLADGIDLLTKRLRKAIHG